MSDALLTADEVYANNEIMAVNAGLGLQMYQLMDLVRAIEAAAATELRVEVARQREVIGRLNSRCDHLGMRLHDVMAERDALRAAAESRAPA